MVLKVSPLLLLCGRWQGVKPSSTAAKVAKILNLCQILAQVDIFRHYPDIIRGPALSLHGLEPCAQELRLHGVGGVRWGWMAGPCAAAATCGSGVSPPRPLRPPAPPAGLGTRKGGQGGRGGRRIKRGPNASQPPHRQNHTKNDQNKGPKMAGEIRQAGGSCIKAGGGRLAIERARQAGPTQHTTH